MWKQGPLPKDTYNFGGVVEAGKDPKSGFYFADFRGDHAILPAQLGQPERRLNPYEVGYFSNALEGICAAPQEV